MRTYIVKSLLSVVATLAMSTDAQACECRWQDAKETYQDSTRVILGEVVKVEQVTTSQNDSTPIQYVATLKPVETYKGASDFDVRVRFTVRRDRMSDCDASMRIGEKYVVFEKELNSLTYEDKCATRIRAAVAKLLDYLQARP